MSQATFKGRVRVSVEDRECGVFMTLAMPTLEQALRNNEKVEQVEDTYDARDIHDKGTRLALHAITEILCNLERVHTIRGSAAQRQHFRDRIDSLQDGDQVQRTLFSEAAADGEQGRTRYTPADPARTAPRSTCPCSVSSSADGRTHARMHAQSPSRPRRAPSSL